MENKIKNAGSRICLFIKAAYLAVVRFIRKYLLGRDMKIRDILDIDTLIIPPNGPAPTNNPPAWDQQPNINFSSLESKSYDMNDISSDADSDPITFTMNTGTAALPTGVTWDAGTGILSYDGVGGDDDTSGHIITLDDGIDTTDSTAFGISIGAVDGYPRIAAGRIGTRDFDSEPEKSYVAQAHFAVINTQPRGSGSPTETETMLAALLSVNPDLTVYLYTDLQEGGFDSGSDEDVRLQSLTGPSNGGSWTPNDGYARDTSGVRISTFGDSTTINITRNMIPHADGRRFPEWKADHEIQVYWLDPHNSPGDTRIHLYNDVTDHKPLTDRTDLDRDGNNDEGRSEWQFGEVGFEIANQWREGHGDFFDRVRENNPDNSDLLIHVNATTWSNETSDPNPANWVGPHTFYDQTVNGGWCENLSHQTSFNFSGINVTTNGVLTSNPDFGSFRMAQNCINFVLRDTLAPKHVMAQWTVGINPASRNPIVGTNMTSASMGLMRWGLCGCLLTDAYFYATPTNFEFNRMILWDEQGVINQGTTGLSREWLGAPIDDSQLVQETALGGSSVWLGSDSNGIFKREFTNGLVLVNSSNSLTGSISITVKVGADEANGELEQGKWRRINGLQDPSYNDGTTVDAGVLTIPAINGIVLERV